MHPIRDCLTDLRNHFNFGLKVMIRLFELLHSEGQINSENLFGNFEGKFEELSIVGSFDGGSYLEHLFI